MRTWRHRKTGRTVNLPDHQSMISTWVLEEDFEDYLPESNKSQIFETYRELVQEGNREMTAHVGDQEYVFDVKHWKKVNKND